TAFVEHTVAVGIRPLGVGGVEDESRGRDTAVDADRGERIVLGGLTGLGRQAQSQSLVESGVRARGRGAESDLGMPLIGSALHVLIEADQPRQLLGTVRRELDHASAAWFSRALFSRALFSRALLSRVRLRVVPSAARHAVTSCG